MNRIGERFAAGKQLIPYVMAGFPTLDASRGVIETLVDAGCTIVEIGIPYSDPLADGPTIQRASEAALAHHVTTDDVFELIEEVRAGRDFSPVLMVYYNLVFRYGLRRFAERAAAAGVEGLIIPDLSVEESADWSEAAESQGLSTIFLTAPTSSEARIAKITEASSGFVYCVSLTGVTGARKALPVNLIDFLKRIRAATDLPIAVGFGIAGPEQAAEITANADGVIVGSALIDIIEQAPDTAAALTGVDTLARSIIGAIGG